MFSEEVVELAPKVYEVLKKLGWEWEPEEGEWFVSNGRTFLIVKKRKKGITYYHDYYGIAENLFRIAIEDVIPILHWEKIKKILEGLGYSIALSISNYGGEIMVTRTDEYEHDATLFESSYKGNNVQEAVMETVIKLGEEK